MISPALRAARESYSQTGGVLPLHFRDGGLAKSFRRAYTAKASCHRDGVDLAKKAIARHESLYLAFLRND